MKRWILFLIGFVLFALSVPKITVMLFEQVSSNNLYERYDIADAANQYPIPASTFTLNNHSIVVHEANYRTSEYQTIQEYPIAFADLTIELNDEQLFVLEDAPLVEEFNGIARYRLVITFLQLRDTNTEENHLYMVTRETDYTLRDGFINYPPLDSSVFTTYAVDQDGDVTERTFPFAARTPVETMLLNNSGTVPVGVGHYTQSFHVYPSLLFPILYPFVSFILSVFLLLRFRPKRRKA